VAGGAECLESGLAGLVGFEFGGTEFGGGDLRGRVEDLAADLAEDAGVRGVDGEFQGLFPAGEVEQFRGVAAFRPSSVQRAWRRARGFLFAEKDVVKWSAATGKPYGVYGITFSARDSTALAGASDVAISETVRVLSGAKFAFFRDSVSLGLAKQRGCTAPIMEFGPDGAFATDLRDDGKAIAFLREHGLEEGKFLCCIPRLRMSPYWKMKPGLLLDEKKHALNESKKEHDLAPLRQAIVEVVRQSPMKVLVCPEDSSQMELGKEMLVDQLPEDVRPRVVWREKYWLTDEALSTYVRSAGLFGAEMHSPIMCIGNGIPAIVCRWTEQTSKGIMWRDIGLGEWLFDMDKEEEIPGILPAVLAMAKDPAAAQAKAAKAREIVQRRQRETMAIVGKSFTAA